jgi:integrase
MARKPNVFPSYLLHQPTGQARVRIDGKDHYLGEYGSEESRIRYGELIAKHAGGVPIDPFTKPNRGRTTTIEPEAGLTINELVLAFMRHAHTHYVKNGKPTSEIHCLKSVTRHLVNLYGFNLVDSFGPMMLKAVRQKFVDSGWVRDTCNKGVKRIRTIFKWGVENEMVSPATLQGLQAVAPLLAGRTEAKDNPDRLPATDEQIEAVKPHVSQLVKDLIDVQRFTGARAGELLLLTPEKLDTTGNVWLFHVDGHKTEHHGHTRVIAIGANAQVVLKRRMKKLKPTDRIFKIRRDSYTLAVRRACVKEGIEPWTPHQLRHAMGHQVRERFGLEFVQAALGHADFAMSEVYAKASLQKAIEVAAAVG